MRETRIFRAAVRVKRLDTSLSSKRIQWKKKDRIILRGTKKRMVVTYWIATVTKVSDTHVWYKFDTGQEDVLERDSRFIFGKTDYTEPRYNSITKKQARRILEDDGDATKRRGQSKPELPDAPFHKTRILRWMNGDRSIIQRHDGLYYLGIVKKAGKGKLRVLYDDGTEEIVRRKSKRILGLSNTWDKDARGVSEKMARKLLQDEGDPDERTEDSDDNSSPYDIEGKSISKKYPKALVVALVVDNDYADDDPDAPVVRHEFDNTINPKTGEKLFTRALVY